MFEAATNTNSSSGDDINDSCNLQGMYERDGRFTSTDYILLNVKTCTSVLILPKDSKVSAEISKAAVIISKTLLG